MNARCDSVADPHTMDPAAVQYITSLQDARAHELDRRNMRGKKRHEFLVRFQRELEGNRRAALHEYIQTPTDTTSEMEKQLVDFVHKTAVWWGALCDQSIEQRLRYEKSVEDQKVRRQEYLRNVEKTEHLEYKAVCKSENARLDAMQSEYAKYEQKKREDSVAAARQSIVKATQECVELMNDYCIENAKENWLVQFAFRKITEKAEFSKKPDCYQNEAFQAIFGKKNAYGITGMSFKELLDFAYQWCDADKRATYEFDACEVPIIMLEGAKLSGKSLLADALEKKFNLIRFNDRSLIEKALNAHPIEQAKGSSSARAKEPELGKTNPFGADEQNEAEMPAPTVDDTLEETNGQQTKIGGTAESNHSVLTNDTIPPGDSALKEPLDGSHFEMASVGSKGNSGVMVSAEISVNNNLGATVHTLTQWVDMGAMIREKLYNGEAIDQSVTSQLLCLQLKDLSAENCSGVIFEGVLNRVVEIPNLLQTLVPKRTNKYDELCYLWCEGLEEDRVARARIKEEEEAAAAQEAVAAAAEMDASSEPEAAKHMRSPRGKRHRSNSRVSTTQSPTLEDCTPEPPAPPPEDVPEILAVARVKLDEPVKKEVRGKGPKRGVDLSQLPPPELPPVDDITEQVKSEELFVSRAMEELESYTGLLSCIMCVSCSPQEIFKRFAGLRIDRDTSEQYHLLYHPPPQTRIPYLIGCDRTTCFSSELYDVVFRQKQEWEELREWLLRQPALCNRVNELEGDKPFDEIVSLASELVQHAIESFNVGKRLYDSMLDARKRIAALKKNRAEQVTAREVERLRLAELYAEKGVPLPPELEATGDTGAWCAVPGDVPPMILQTVQEFHHHYGGTYNDAWAEFSSLSCMILEYRRSARSQLTRFWGQPDDKQAILDRFLRQFNSVPKRFRCKPACKEEFHLLTDELSTNLFASVESKKKDAFTLIDHVVRRDAYLDGWEANVCNIGALLVQQEVERFTLVVNLTMLYFGAAHEEPVMFEEIDTDVSLIRTLEAATGDLAGAGKSKTDKKSVSARKGHGRPNDESGDSSILEAFLETVQRLVNGITTLTEKFKLKVTADASGKGQKKVTLRSLKLSAITVSCTPFLETEQAAALERIASVKRFVSELARQGEAYMHSIKAEMMADAKRMLLQQASAVNSAIFAIRCAIEEEDDVSPMHIGCGTFSVLQPKRRDRAAVSNAVKNPCFITDVPLFARETDLITPIHDTLSASRLMELIQHFRCAAPEFKLCRDRFTTIVIEEDYAGAAKEGEYLLSPGEVFRCFDPANTGVMDWREFVLHLLLWCCPPVAKGEKTRYIPEVTIPELQRMKNHLGIEEVTNEQLNECPFYFDPYLKADRREVYVRALWYTFQRPGRTTINAFDLLCFFCIDPQPIRGIQKAFSLFSERKELLSMPMLERILHVRSTNARAMALLDPFSKPNLYILMGSRSLISFRDVCSCAMGRYIFNRFDVMMRKKFVCNVS